MHETTLTRFSKGNAAWRLQRPRHGCYLGFCGGRNRPLHLHTQLKVAPSPPPPGACPHLPGYQSSWGVEAAQVIDQPRQTMAADVAALAARCDNSATCAGFSSTGELDYARTAAPVAKRSNVRCSLYTNTVPLRLFEGVVLGCVVGSIHPTPPLWARPGPFSHSTWGDSPPVSTVALLALGRGGMHRCSINS